jgi:UbiD family decarboxylase
MLGLASESELMTAWPQLSSKRLHPKKRDQLPVERIVFKGIDIDLNNFPILKHFESDCAPYITGGVTLATDPDTGIGNLSYARLQIKGKQKLGMSLHSRGNLWDIQRRCEERNQALEVAIVIGMHPAFNIAAATRLPLGEDEMDLAGGLMGEAVELIPAESVDLFIPAYAEMVIEGVIEPNIREDEGPFGEYTGYATSRSTRHVMRVTAITTRKDMIYHDITPGAASEHLNLSKTSRVPQFFAALKKTLPNVVAMNYPSSGTHFHCYLSMRKTMDGQARQAMSILFGLDVYLKLIVVVDEDIDVLNEQQVLWAIATRFQADRDLYLQPNMPCNLLDPSSQNGLSAKMGMDATRKFDPDVISLSFSPEIMHTIQELIKK